jgi:hypothetical protein
MNHAFPDIADGEWSWLCFWILVCQRAILIDKGQVLCTTLQAFQSIVALSQQLLA